MDYVVRQRKYAIIHDYVKKGFVSAIEQYAQNSRLIKQHGLAGRKRLETQYSWENNAKILQDIYERIVGKNSKTWWNILLCRKDSCCSSSRWCK